MTLEENKRIVRRYFEEAPQHPEICDEIFAPLIHFQTLQHATLSPDTDSTPEQEKAAYQWLHKVWGDFTLKVDQIIAEGDRVMVSSVFQGRQEGEFYSLPPTDRVVYYAGINIFRIEKGKIAEVWDIYDRMWLWQQLGVLPEIRDAIAAARSQA